MESDYLIPNTTAVNSKGWMYATIMGKGVLTTWGPLSRFERKCLERFSNPEMMAGWNEAEAELRPFLENPDGI